MCMALFLDIHGFRRWSLRHPSEQLPPSIPLFLSNMWECTKDFDIVKSTPPKCAPKLRSVPAALELINSIEKPIAILSICGPYRTGKSYFASKVLDLPNTFRVGCTFKPCTHGIWMATNVLECDDYVLLVFDMEGTEAVGKDETEDIVMSSFLVMTTLISSYLVYNSKHVPQKRDVEEMK